MTRWTPALAVLFATSPALAQINPTPAEQPSAYPPEPPPPPVAPTAARSDRASLFGSIEGGYAYQTLYGIGVRGADITAVVGATLRDFDVGCQIQVVPGHSDEGLDTMSLGIGPVFEGHVGALRLGAGVRFGTFDVTRVTNGPSLISATVGLFARASFDVVPFGDDGHGAVFLVAKASLDTVGGSLFGLSAGAGVRF